MAKFGKVKVGHKPYEVSSDSTEYLETRGSCCIGLCVHMVMLHEKLRPWLYKVLLSFGALKSLGNNLYFLVIS